jgi:hypothetical protein
VSSRSFSYTSANLIDAQPAATDYLYARSTSAADTTQTLTLYDSTHSAAATLTGQKEIVTTSTFDSMRWITLSGAAAGTVSVYSEDNASAGVGDIRVDTNPTAADTLSVGLSGAVVAYTFVVTPSTTNDIKIGTTTAETADNIASAINDTSTGTTTPVDGTDWGTGTVVNPYVSATVASTVVTVTDRVSCRRSLAWAIVESTDNFSIRQPSGGVNGTLLSTIDPGDTEYYNGDLELDTEDLATETLPATKTGATDSINVGGRKITLDIYCENISPAISMKYEVSNDNTTWFDGQDTIAAVDNNHQYITPEENIEYIRLNITANTATASTALNAKVIY